MICCRPCGHLVPMPTLTASEEAKGQFNGQFIELIRGCPKDETIFLLGDLNGRMGADHESWPICLMHHNTGKLNKKGQRLLELCAYHDLCITNTFLLVCHPKSHCCHQLDLIIARHFPLRLQSMCLPLTRLFRTSWRMMPMWWEVSWMRSSTTLPCPHPRRNSPARTGLTSSFHGWNQKLRPNGRPSWLTRGIQVKAHWQHSEVLGVSWNT